MPSTADLRRLLITGTAVDRRSAWTIVQRAPELDRDFQRLLVESGQLGYGQRLEFVTIAGYEFEQVTYPDGGLEIKLGEFEIKEETLEEKIAGVGFVANPDRDHPDGYNTDISTANYPRPTGNKVVRLSLINTGRDMQQWNHFEAMTTRLSRTEGDVYQGLEVVRKHPDLQRALAILTFGSRLRPHWCSIVPHFDVCKAGRLFGLCRFVRSFNNGSWALVAG